MLMISDDAYEQLRQILEEQNERSYSLEEIKEIGDELLNFYMLMVDIENKVSKRESDQPNSPGGGVGKEAE